MECVQTDNGFEFTNRFSNSKRDLPTLFETTAAQLGIRHKLIRPYTPRHNGKVERSHREVQKRFYSCHSFYSLDDFARQLAAHNRRSNNFPMRPLNYCTPSQFAVQKEIIQGAALIAGVTYDMKEGDRLTNKIPVLSLNRLIMENAELVHAPRISPPREKTGSSDFSNVMYQLPGSCIRVAMVPKGTSSHSLEFLNAGKGEEAHEAVLIAAKVLSGTACDLTENPALLEEIQSEFRENQEKHS